VNAVVSTMTAEFWNGTAWTAFTGFADGTSAGGATFAQSGDISWTVPTTWVATNLDLTMVQGLQNPGVPTVLQPVGLAPSQRRQWQENAAFPVFWSRLTVSAALTANTAMNSFFALNRSTLYAQMLESSLEAFRVQKSLGGVSAIEALTDAGTANLIVNAYMDSPLGQF
jgi:hypothetical protein